MKKLLLLLIFIPQIIWGISNIQYSQLISRGMLYDATLLEHNDKLYVSGKGGVEEYLIEEDGSLELNSYLNFLSVQTANAKIFGDTLMVVHQRAGNNTGYEISFINISGEQMEINHNIILANMPVKLAVNNDYIFYVNNSETNCTLLSRNTLEPITSLPTGGYFTVVDTILFKEMINGNDSALSILNISDVNNPIELSFTLTGEFEKNLIYYFKDNYLFIARNRSILILDISDLNSPNIVSVISDIPNVDNNYNMFNNMEIVNNYLIFMNQESTIWIYDISDLENPQYQLTNHDFEPAYATQRCLLFSNNHLYLTGEGNDINQIDTISLPTINILEKFGNNIFYSMFHNQSDNFLFFNNITTNSLSYININNATPEIQTLHSANYTIFTSDVDTTNNLLFNISMDNLNYNTLRIYHYDQETITQVNEIHIFSNLINIFLQNGYIVLTGNNPGMLKIYEIDDGYNLNAINTTYLGSQIYICNQTSQFDLPYIYVRYKANTDYRIKILENTYPFEEVTDFSIYSLGREMYLLENDKVLVTSYNGIKLYQYQFPDQFNLIESLVTSDPLTVYDNYFLTSPNYSGETTYYTWENNEIEEVYNYDFGFDIYDNVFFPDQNKLYAMGRYTIAEYTCEYTNVDDVLIPDIYPINISNYPNPFNPSTTISFNSAKAEKDTKITIYNLKGEKVREISVTNCKQGENKVTWNGKNNNNKKVTSGVYLYQLQQNGKTVATKKMIMVK